MKLRYEQFEAIACFNVRGKIEATQLRILAIGLETLIKDLQSPLVVNLTHAEVDEVYLKTLIEIKKALTKLTRQKLYWVGKGKGLFDFPEVSLLFSRLGGFKIRQIGERLKLEDSIFSLQTQMEYTKAKVDALGGDEDNAHKIILENKILREQARILKSTLQFQEERIKAQEKVPFEDAEYEEKVKVALETLKTAYGSEIKL
jgi:hypothetical protein